MIYSRLFCRPCRPPTPSVILRFLMPTTRSGTATSHPSRRKKNAHICPLHCTSAEARAKMKARQHRLRLPRRFHCLRSLSQRMPQPSRTTSLRSKDGLQPPLYSLMSLLHRAPRPPPHISSPHIPPLRGAPPRCLRMGAVDDEAAALPPRPRLHLHRVQRSARDLPRITLIPPP